MIAFGPSGRLSRNWITLASSTVSRLSTYKRPLQPFISERICVSFWAVSKALSSGNPSTSAVLSSNASKLVSPGRRRGFRSPLVLDLCGNGDDELERFLMEGAKDGPRGQRCLANSTYAND